MVVATENKLTSQVWKSLAIPALITMFPVYNNTASITLRLAESCLSPDRAVRSNILFIDSTSCLENVRSMRGFTRMLFLGAAPSLPMRSPDASLEAVVIVPPEEVGRWPKRRVGGKVEQGSVHRVVTLAVRVVVSQTRAHFHTMVRRDGAAGCPLPGLSRRLADLGWLEGPSPLLENLHAATPCRWLARDDDSRQAAEFEAAISDNGIGAGCARNGIRTRVRELIRVYPEGLFLDAVTRQAVSMKRYLTQRTAPRSSETEV